jgi:hypothetical protein
MEDLRVSICLTSKKETQEAKAKESKPYKAPLPKTLLEEDTHEIEKEIVEAVMNSYLKSGFNVPNWGKAGIRLQGKTKGTQIISLCRRLILPCSYDSTPTRSGRRGKTTL